MIDGRKRNIDYLRISVTDQCNLRCLYCMPEEEIESVSSFLGFDEIVKICETTAKLGVSKIKITGGEPLMRKNLPELIERMLGIEGIRRVTLTTNGILLREQLEDLKKAGLSGINISFDTRKPEKYHAITRRNCYHKALEGLLKSVSSGIPTKVNTIIMKGINQDEIAGLASFAKEYPVDVRFIELMPLGCGQGFEGVSEDEIRKEIQTKYGELVPCTTVHGNGPAIYYDIPGFLGSIGFISALSHGFCGKCNRIRLTCDGLLKLCLQYEDSVDLKPYLQKYDSKGELMRAIEEALDHKPASHQFEKSAANKEKKFMHQIGG